MNALIDKGIVKEIKSGNNFEFVITGEADFLDTDYKILQSHSNDMFVKCMKIMRNGQIDLCYLGNDYSPVSGMLSDLTSDKAIALLNGIISCIIKIKTNGFLSCQSILLDKDKIFIDANTMKVFMVYIPVTAKLYVSIGDFENALRDLAGDILGAVMGDKTEKLMMLMADVADRSISFEQIYQKCRDAALDANTASLVAPKKPAANNSGNLNGAMKLVACNAPYPFEILITEDDVLIGKKADLVDKVIDFNGAISRRHCRIVKQNGTFFIMDEGSANGTFVNNVRVSVGQKLPLQSGDILRLANSDFRIN